MRALLSAAAMLLALLGLTGAAGALEVPALVARVNDRAGLLEPEARARLERKLQAYEQRTGQQFVLLIVPSLEGDPIEDFSIRVAERWQVGRKGKDDGLLLLIAAAERQVRVEVGYGLEGEITDALSSRVIRNVISPAFRRGDFAGGIDQALDVLMRAASGEAVDVPEAEPGGEGESKGSLWPFLIMFILFMLLSSLNGGRRRRVPWYLGGGHGGFSGRGGSSGGRGFSGGGGRFGGGGASGGW